MTEQVGRHEVRAGTIVQVSGSDGFDNRYIRSVALQNPHWTAGICTLDPLDEEPPAVQRPLARAGSMRSVPASGNRLDHSGIRALRRAASAEGLPVNLLGSRLLEAQLTPPLEHSPSLPVLLDHSLGLRAVNGGHETLRMRERLSRHRHLHTRLSFIANGELGCEEGFPCSGIHGAMLRGTEIFGAERCVWGSHFPTAQSVHPLPSGEHLQIHRRQVLGEMACRIWFPELGRRP